MISLLLCAADLVLKAEARKKLPDHGGEKRITKHLAGRILYNRGFAMGKAEDRPDLVRGLSFAAVIIYFMQIIPALRVKGGNLIKAGCALTLGGALGNLTERLGSGSVTDYASLRTGKKIDRIVFNFADVCILLGAVIAGAGVLAGIVRKALARA